MKRENLELAQKIIKEIEQYERIAHKIKDLVASPGIMEITISKYIENTCSSRVELPGQFWKDDILKFLEGAKIKADAMVASLEKKLDEL
jgi:hypothetical protein